jgi:hypothetical protein
MARLKAENFASDTWEIWDHVRHSGQSLSTTAIASARSLVGHVCLLTAGTTLRLGRRPVGDAQAKLEVEQV